MTFDEAYSRAARLSPFNTHLSDILTAYVSGRRTGATIVSNQMGYMMGPDYCKTQLGYDIACGKIVLTKRDFITLIQMLEKEYTSVRGPWIVSQLMAMYCQQIGDDDNSFMALFKLYAPSAFTKRPSWNYEIQKAFTIDRSRSYYLLVIALCLVALFIPSINPILGVGNMLLTLVQVGVLVIPMLWAVQNLYQLRSLPMIHHDFTTAGYMLPLAPPAFAVFLGVALIGISLLIVSYFFGSLVVTTIGIIALAVITLMSFVVLLSDFLMSSRYEPCRPSVALANFTAFTKRQIRN